MTHTIEIFTDGACKGNPGPGGWGVLLKAGRHEKTMHGGEHDTTNNRMELIGAIAGLEALNRPCRVRITTDSEYVKKGMTEWIDGCHSELELALNDGIDPRSGVRIGPPCGDLATFGSMDEVKDYARYCLLENYTDEED